MQCKIIGLFFSIILAYNLCIYGADFRIVSRKNYKKIADFVYDEGCKRCDPNKVKPGSIVYLAGEVRIEYFNKIHPKIKHPYIMIYAAGGLYGSILDDPKIVHFFCLGGDGPLKNNHPKYSYIPIGICSIKGSLPTASQISSLRSIKKEKLAYMNFTIQNNREARMPVYNALKFKPWVTKAAKKPFHTYLEEMAQHKFIISPPGDVQDCYRHWEAILVGSIPIMWRSPRNDFHEFFEGLPVLIINDWSEVTEAFLNRKYKEIASQEYNLEKLYLQYWIDRINEIRRLLI